MKRLLSAVLATALLLFAFSAFAVASEKAAGKSQTITGEVVDLGCPGPDSGQGLTPLQLELAR